MVNNHYTRNITARAHSNYTGSLCEQDPLNNQYTQQINYNTACTLRPIFFQLHNSNIPPTLENIQIKHKNITSIFAFFIILHVLQESTNISVKC